MIIILLYFILAIAFILILLLASVGIYFKVKEGKCNSKARLDGKLAIVTGASSGELNLFLVELHRFTKTVGFAWYDR